MKEQGKLASLLLRATTMTEKFDPTVALAGVAGEQELLIDVLNSFLDEYPEVLDKIQTNFAEGKADELRTEVHKMKGNLRFLGQDERQVNAQQIEEQVAKGDLSNLKEPLAQLHQEVEQVANMVRAYIAAQ